MSDNKANTTDIVSSDKDRLMIQTTYTWRTDWIAQEYHWIGDFLY